MSWHQVVSLDDRVVEVGRASACGRVRGRREEARDVAICRWRHCSQLPALASMYRLAPPTRVRAQPRNRAPGAPRRAHIFPRGLSATKASLVRRAGCGMRRVHGMCMPSAGASTGRRGVGPAMAGLLHLSASSMKHPQKEFAHTSTTLTCSASLPGCAGARAASEHLFSPFRSFSLLYLFLYHLRTVSPITYACMLHK